MIFDIILIAVFAVLIFVAMRRGAVRSLANVIACIVSFFGATALGRLLADYCYKWFVEPAIEKAVSNAITNVSSDVSAGIADALPGWVTALLNTSGADIGGLFTKPIVASKDVLVTAVNKGVYPVAIALLTFFITIILAILLLMLTKRFLIPLLIGVFKLPVLRTVDKVLGIAVGFVEALLLMCLFAYLTKLFLANIGSTSSWFNEEKIYNSFIFKHIYDVNIFTWLGSLIKG